MSPEEVPLRSCHIGTVKSHVALVPQLFVFELIWFPENGSLWFSSDITNTGKTGQKAFPWGHQIGSWIFVSSAAIDLRVNVTLFLLMRTLGKRFPVWPDWLQSPLPPWAIFFFFPLTRSHLLRVNRNLIALCPLYILNIWQSWAFTWWLQLTVSPLSLLTHTQLFRSK